MERRADPRENGHDAWPAYVAAAASIFAIYGVGASTPYIQAALGLSDAQVGLHGTAMAIGMTATLVAPLALGILADAAGVVVGWGLVLGFAVIALVLVAALPAGTPADAGPPVAAEPYVG